MLNAIRFRKEFPESNYHLTVGENYEIVDVSERFYFIRDDLGTLTPIIKDAIDDVYEII